MIPRVIHHSSMTNIQLLQECRHQILSFCLIVRHYSCTAPEPAQQASEFTRKDPVPLHCMTLSQVTSSCTAVHSSNHHIQPTDFEPNWTTLKPSNLGGRAAAQVPECPPSLGGWGVVWWYFQCWKISGAALLIWRGRGHVLQWPGSTGVTAGWQGRGWSFLLPGVV